MPMSVVVLGEPVRGTSIEIVNGFSSSSSASNVGTGVGVYKQQIGSNLEFKSLVSGSGITLTNNANDITISADASSLPTFASLDPGSAVVTIGANYVTTSTTTSAQIYYLHTLRSDVQIQIDDLTATKQSLITGAASTITGLNLDNNKAVMTNASGKIIASSVTDAELYSLTGVTGGFIQTQLNTLTAAVATKIGNPLTSDLYVPLAYTIYLGNVPTTYLAINGAFITGNASISTSGNVSGGLVTAGSFSTTTSGASSGETFRMKSLPIGGWDMDVSELLLFVPTGINNSKIRSTSLVLFDNIGGVFVADSGANYTERDVVYDFTSTTVSFARRPSGLFDTANFAGALVNRGYLTIWYAI